MTSEERQPKKWSKSFVCPRCSVYAAQDWYVLKAAPKEEHAEEIPGDKWINLSPQPRQMPYPDAWTASRCQHCDRASVWHGSEIVYPPRIVVGPPPADDLTGRARELYEEAREVAAVSRRAGAAFMRASLEQLVKVLSPDKGTLHERVGRLKPTVSAGLGLALDVLRDTGNGVLHDDVPEGVAALVVAETADESGVFDYLANVVNRLVGELITQPKMDAEMFDLLPDKVQDGIRQRDAKTSGTGATS